MRALSIRQPYAELIMRGIKTVEYRSGSTRIIGERFYIYASKKKLSVASCQWPVVSGQLSVASCQWPVKAWSDDLRAGTPPAWMIELAEQVKLIEAGAILPTGVIVGSAVIDYVTEIRSQKSDGENLTSDLCPLTSSSPTSLFAWHLTDVKRAKKFRKPRGHPQPVWFRPF